MASMGSTFQHSNQVLGIATAQALPPASNGLGLETEGLRQALDFDAGIIKTGQKKLAGRTLRNVGEGFDDFEAEIDLKPLMLRVAVNPNFPDRHPGFRPFSRN